MDSLEVLVPLRIAGVGISEHLDDLQALLVVIPGNFCLTLSLRDGAKLFMASREDVLPIGITGIQMDERPTDLERILAGVQSIFELVLHKESIAKLLQDSGEIWTSSWHWRGLDR